MSAESLAIARSRRKTGPRQQIKRFSALTQALDQRDNAYQQSRVIQALPPANDTDEARTRAQTLRDLNTVWDTCCERIMVLQGRGRPKSVTARNDPDAKARSKPKLGVLPEPLDAEKKAG